MQKIRWLLLIIAILLAMALVLQNHGTVEVKLLWLSQTLPLSILLSCTTAIGFLLGALLTAFMLRRRGKPAAAKKSKTVASESKPTSQAEPKATESHPLQ